MYSYMFHIMKYYLYCIYVTVMQTTSLTSVVKDFSWPGKRTAASYSPDTLSEVDWERRMTC
jgi:hypothetical protein